MDKAQSAVTQTIRIQLEFPLDRVKEPLVYRLVKDYNLVPNIRKANIDPRMGGYLFMDLTGQPDDIVNAIEFLRDVGVTVNTIGVDGAQEWLI